MGPMGPHGNGSSSSVASLLWIIILLLLVIIGYLWYNESKKNIEINDVKPSEIEVVESDKIEVALRLLNENEKRVVQAIIDNGGEMLQKDISYELELSRVQTHRTIQSLIEREIVTTEEHYNTKKVALADWLR
jgi:hypothetical protein